jgi:molecular chaperone Hsp33
LQFLPQSPERARRADLDPGDVPEGIEVKAVPEDDAWIEGRALVASVEDVELLDPDTSAERLLYRLFNERGVRVFRSRDLLAQCSCSRERVERMLRSFSQDDRDHMVENGKITVTCEFCNSTYVFEPEDVAEATQTS